jgi:S1-C subfamily serine protease
VSLKGAPLPRRKHCGLNCAQFLNLLKLLVGVSLATISAIRPNLASEDQRINSWVKVVETARPAVVIIETDKALGSGFIVKPDGTILTNQHVIAGANKILIKLASGEVYRRAWVLALDESKDVAILRIEAIDLPVIPLGNSDRSEVGEEVILLGAPQGLEQTVSNGLISSIRLTESGLRVIQTTAAASPGSSGGPLLNARGEAVGVLSFSVVSGQNLNFAVPINYVRGMIEALTLTAGNTAPKLLDSSSGVKAFSRPLETPKKHGVLVSGYGYPAESFRYIFLELMDHLASCGVEIANDPSEFKPVSGDAASLNYLIENLPKIGADSLLYVKVEHGWSNIHRLKLECFDAKGVLLWEESASSSTSWATSEGGAARAVVERIKKKLAPRIGKPGLPLKANLRENPSSSESAKP